MEYYDQGKAYVARMCMTEPYKSARGTRKHDVNARFVQQRLHGDAEALHLLVVRNVRVVIRGWPKDHNNFITGMRYGQKAWPGL